MYKMKYWFLAILLSFFLSGCGSLPEDLDPAYQEAIDSLLSMTEIPQNEESDKPADKPVDKPIDMPELSIDSLKDILMPERTPAENILSAEEVAKAPVAFDYGSIPAYDGSMYVTVNGNMPYFADNELSDVSYEHYSELDALGRCGVCVASIGKDIMPTEERGEIGEVKPSGWHTVKYPGIVDDNYLYNRCHIIGYQLTGENANERNLITGTRAFNVDGMLPFENMIAGYVRRTGNHVMYRVTPVFEGDNLLMNGVLMEAKSVEDNGKGLAFCVFCYNVQSGIVIDYATGDSHALGVTE